MADNVAITAGTGTTVAADDIGGVMHQRVKLSLGADGTANDASAGAGAVGTGTQRVTLGSDDPAVTALQVMDDWDESDRAKVNLIVGQAGIAAGAGAVGATVPRVTLASDDPLVALVSGTNTQLPVTPSGVVSVDITRPANTTAYAAGDVVGGAITFATGMTSGQRVMITGFDLMPKIAAIPASMTSFRLHLYNVTPPSAIADNAAWDLPSGDRASYLGYIDVGSPADFGSTLFCQLDNINKQVQMSGSASIFGYLMTNGGYTPAANSEVYTCRMTLLGL